MVLTTVPTTALTVHAEPGETKEVSSELIENAERAATAAKDAAAALEDDKSDEKIQVAEDAADTADAAAQDIEDVLGVEGVEYTNRDAAQKAADNARTAANGARQAAEVAKPSDPPADPTVDANALFEKLRTAVDNAEKAITDNDKTAADAAVSEITTICGDDAAVEAIASVDGGTALLEQAYGVGEAVAEAFPESPDSDSDTDSDLDSDSNPDDGITLFAMLQPTGVKPVDVTVVQKDITSDDEDQQSNVSNAVKVEWQDSTVVDDQAYSDDIKFTLTANDGWTFVADCVDATADGKKEGESDPVVSNGTVDADGKTSTVYTVAHNSTTQVDGEDGKKVTKNCFSGEVTITIEVKQVAKTLKLTESDENAYLKTGSGIVVRNDQNAVTNQINNTTGQKITWDAANKDVTVAVEVDDALTNTKYEYIQVKVDGQTAPEATKDVAAAAEPVEEGGKKYCLYTFNPSELTGFAKNKNEAIIITAAPSAKSPKALNLTVDSNAATQHWAVKAPAAAGTNPGETSYDENYDFIKSNSSGVFTASPLNEDNYEVKNDKDRAIAFKVLGNKVKGDAAASTFGDPSSQYAVTEVSAELTKTGDSTVLQTLEVEHFDNNTTEGTAADDYTYLDDDYYYIVLKNIDKKYFASLTGSDSLTLTIKAKTALPEANNDVYAAKFEGDTKNLKTLSLIATNADVADVNLLDKNYAYEGYIAKGSSAPYATATFKVEAKDGYTIKEGTDFSDPTIGGKPVVIAKYDKVYVNAESEFGEDSITVEGVEEELGIADDPINTFVFTFSGSDKDYAENAEGNRRYKATNVVFTVTTELAATEGGTVKVVSNDLDYTLEGEGVEKSGEDTYAISDTAKALKLTVVSEEAPTATYGKVSSSATEGGTVSFTKGTGIYEAEIPVNQLYVDGEKIKSTITITKGTKGLTLLQKEGTSAASGYTGKVVINDTEIPSGDINGSTGVVTNGGGLTYGDKASVVMEAPTGYELTGVEIQKTETKNGGEVNKGEAEKIDLADGAESAAFTLEMTDNVEVTASVRKIYTVEVTYTGAAAPVDPVDDEYIIPEGSKGIQITLKNGGITTGVNLRYAKLYDNDAPAATKATVGGAAATISEIDKNDTGVLRVDLVLQGTDEVAASVNIRQEKAAGKLTIKDENGSSVNAPLSMMADSHPRTLTVEAADGGNVVNALSNIGVEVLNTDGKTYKAVSAGLADGTAIVSNKEVKVTVKYDNGTVKLVAEALPALAGKEKAAAFRLYDKKAREAAKKDKNATDKDCLMADEIVINTTDPSIIGQKPIVEIENSNPMNIRLKLSTGNNIAHPYIDGDNGDGTATRGNVVLYKVTVDGPMSNDLKSKSTRYFKKHSYGNAGETDYYTFPVLSEKEKEENIKANDYTVSVELVQTTRGTLGQGSYDEDAESQAQKDESAKVLVHGGAIETVTTRTPDPTLEANLKLSPTSATVQTTQDWTVATRAQYSGITGWKDVAKLEFINTSTGVKLGTESYIDVVDGHEVYYPAESDDSMSAEVDEYGYIRILSLNATANRKNLGLKVTVEAPDSVYAASAVLKINTVQGYDAIQFVSGGIRKLYKQPGKAANMQLNAVFYEGGEESKPKSKKINYYLLTDADDFNNDIAGFGWQAPSSEVLSYVSVNQKSGKITVDKNFTVDTKNPAKNTFIVAAFPDGGYQSNAWPGYVKVTITGEAQALGSAVIVRQDGDNDYKIVARDGGILKAEDFFKANGDEADLYVRTLTTTAVSKRAYTENDFANDGVTYASGTKGCLAVSSVDGKLSFVKAQAKPVKLTVTPADGSKNKNAKKEISVTLQGYAQVGLKITGNELHEAQKDPSVTTLTYDGVMNAKFNVVANQKVNGKWMDAGYPYSSMNIKAKGARLDPVKVGKTITGYTLLMTSPSASVTVTDKSTRQSMTYTINQVPPMVFKNATASVKADKLTADDVKRAYDFANTVPGVEQVKVNFQVTTKKGVEPENYARKYVFVAPDFTKTKKVEDLVEYERAKKYFLNNEDSQIVQLDDYGRFSLNFSVDQKKYMNIPGSYTLIVTVGEYSDGRFSPLAKGVNVKVNVPTDKVKNDLKVKGKYVLDPGAMEPVKLSADGNIVTSYDWNVVNAPAINDTKNGYQNYALNKVDPKTGKPNNFNKYFEVKMVGGDWVLGLRSGLTKADISAITSKQGKADCEGYVTIATSNKIGTQLLRKDMKITVAFKNTKKLAAKLASGSSVYTGEEATIQIFESEASKTPIDLAAVYVAEGATLSDVKNAVDSKTGLAKDSSTDIKVKLNAAAAGKQKVVLKVLTANSAYANLESKELKEYDKDKKALAQAYGCEVVAQITVSDKGDKTKGKAVIKVDDDEITSKDYRETGSKYIKNYKIESGIQGANIAGVEISKSVGNKAFEGANVFTAAMNGDKLVLTVKRDKLVAANAVKGGKIKFGKSVDIPVKVTFDKKDVTPEICTVKVVMPSPMTYEDAVKAVEPLKQKISSMKADLLFVAADNAKADLEKRINDMINSYIPMDAQLVRVGTKSVGHVSVGGNYTGYELAFVATKPADAEKNTAEVPAHYELDLRFKKDDTVKNDDAYKVSFSFGNYEVDGTIGEVVTAINGLTKANLPNLGNNYSSEKLLEDIKTMLPKATADHGMDTKIPSNLMITVESFKLTKATTKADGKLVAFVKIRDRITGRLTPNVRVGAVGGIELTEFKDLAEAKTIIEGAWSSFDSAAVLREAMQDENATIDSYRTALEAALKKFIDEKKGSEDITFEFVPSTVHKTEGSAPVTSTLIDLGLASEGEDVTVDFKLPKAGGVTAGWIAFKGYLKQDGMKDLLIDHTKVKSTGGNQIALSIPATTDVLYQKIGASAISTDAATKAVADVITANGSAKTVAALKKKVTDKYLDAKGTNGGTISPCYRVELEVTSGTGDDAVVLTDGDEIPKGQVTVTVTVTDKLGRGLLADDSIDVEGETKDISIITVKYTKS